MVFSFNLVRRYGEPQDRARAYLLFGLGVFDGFGSWPGDSGLSPTVGIGVRIYVTRHLFVAPQVRLGYVPTSRLSLALGYRL